MSSVARFGSCFSCEVCMEWWADGCFSSEVYMSSMAVFLVRCTWVQWLVFQWGVHGVMSLTSGFPQIPVRCTWVQGQVSHWVRCTWSDEFDRRFSTERGALGGDESVCMTHWLCCSRPTVAISFVYPVTSLLCQKVWIYLHWGCCWFGFIFILGAFWMLHGNMNFQVGYITVDGHYTLR